MIKGRILEGVVVSDKMQKTRVVEVISRTRHPIYGRFLVKKKRYKVHDGENKSKLGERVRIVECRPYSKEKHFRLLEVIR